MVIDIYKDLMVENHSYCSRHKKRWDDIKLNAINCINYNIHSLFFFLQNYLI